MKTIQLTLTNWFSWMFPEKTANNHNAFRIRVTKEQINNLLNEAETIKESFPNLLADRERLYQVQYLIESINQQIDKYKAELAEMK